MPTQLVLTVIGEDKPGLVKAVSRVVEAHGANWEASRMARLGGRFAGILLVSTADDRADALRAGLESLGEQGLRVMIDDATPEGQGADARSLRLDLVGTDRHGIIHEISAALAAQQISVVELSSKVRDAPMAGGTLFEAELALRCPMSVSTGELREVLESLADELMVDIQLDETVTSKQRR